MAPSRIQKKHISLRGYDLTELKTLIKSTYGEKSFRAVQLYNALFNIHRSCWRDISNLPHELLVRLAHDFRYFSLDVQMQFHSKSSASQKIAYKTYDDRIIETVLIKAPRRNTACLSTQIGCRFGCVFCASGKKGFVRNLDTSEIIDQYVLLEKLIDKRISNIVIMGMGEPFDNYDALISALRILTNEQARNISDRHITVSTAGIPEKIEAFAHEGLEQIKFALSLHAPNEALRSELMPINKKYPLKDVVASIKKNRKKFKRTVTLEYVLLKNINDKEEHAEELADIAHMLDAKINLIVYNRAENDTETFVPSKKKRVEDFVHVLKKKAAICTLRKSEGDDIAAACGQLRCKLERS